MDRLYNRGKTLLSSLKPQLPVKRDEVVRGGKTGNRFQRKQTGERRLNRVPKDDNNAFPLEKARERG